MQNLMTCNSRVEAELIRTKLAAYGIASIISADDMAGLRPHMSLLGGVKVLVAKADLEKAQEVLAISSTIA